MGGHPPKVGGPNLTKRKKPTFVGVLPPFLEREKRFELSTSTLARWHSTAELLPRTGRLNYPPPTGLSSVGQHFVTESSEAAFRL